MARREREGTAASRVETQSGGPELLARSPCRYHRQPLQGTVILAISLEETMEHEFWGLYVYVYMSAQFKSLLGTRGVPPVHDVSLPGLYLFKSGTRIHCGLQRWSVVKVKQ